MKILSGCLRIRIKVVSILQPVGLECRVIPGLVAAVIFILIGIIMHILIDLAAVGVCRLYALVGVFGLVNNIIEARFERIRCFVTGILQDGQAFGSAGAYSFLGLDDGGCPFVEFFGLFSTDSAPLCIGSFLPGRCIVSGIRLGFYGAGSWGCLGNRGYDR